MSLEWLDRARCRQYDPDSFYPSRGAGHAERVAAALAICALCPVRGPCLADTLSMPATQRQVGMIRAGRYYPTAKTAEDRTEGGPP